MRDDWKAGDLALCVNAGPIDPNYSGAHIGLIQGKIYWVLAVADGLPWSVSGPGLGIMIDGPSNQHTDGTISYYWHPLRFRKVKPDTEACNREEWELIINVNKSRIRERG